MGLFLIGGLLLLRLGQIVWFVLLSAISQLACRVGEGGVGQICLHSVTHYTALHYLAQVAGAGRGVALAFPTLGINEHEKRIPLMASLLDWINH
jgi:hypothetical protein